MRIRGICGPGEPFQVCRGPYPLDYSLAEGATKSNTSLPAQHLAAQHTYNHLDMSVGEALRQRTLCLEGVLSCQPKENLGEVIDRIVREQVPYALHTCSHHIWFNASHELLQLFLYIGHTCPVLFHGQPLGVHTGLQLVLFMGPSGYGPQPAHHPREVRTSIGF